MARWLSSRIPVTSDFPCKASELARIRSRVLILFITSSPFWKMKLSCGLVILNLAAHSNHLEALKKEVWGPTLRESALIRRLGPAYLSIYLPIFFFKFWDYSNVQPVLRTLNEANCGFIRCSEFRNWDIWQMPGEWKLPSLRFWMLFFSSPLSFNTGNLVLACLNRIMTTRTMILLSDCWY